ncbi:astakine-like isoform X2 [Lycorma delicatula]|uniref:astakine-like isoform X2 n=1 Tax=Lycorma delicatula TaxID=130591 RepID=UPI003F510F25
MRLISSSLLLLQAILVYFSFSATSSPSRPHYIECQSSEECGSVACCVIGNARFSLPSCRSLLQAGDTCISRAYQPFNTTVIYPDGAEVKLTNVYRTFCPCEAGLHCRHDGICFDPTLKNRPFH